MRSKTLRLVVLLAALVMVFALVGCGDDEATETTAAPATTATTAAPTATTAAPATTATTAAAGSFDDLEYYEFSLSMHDPATSNNGMFYQAWADALLEATDGHVKVVLYPSSQLAAAADVGEMVETGAVDIGWVFTSFYPGQFPLTDVTTIPMVGFGDALVSTNTLWDLYDKYPELQNEWANYKLLNLYGNPGMLFCSADKPIEKPEDLKGLVLRTPAGPITNLVTNLGASPVVMPPPDMYEALEKKNITGYVFEPAGITNFKLEEVTKYFLDMPLYDGAFGLVMNWDKWNALPPEFQAIIEGVTGKTGSLAAAQNFSDAAAGAHKTISDAGGEWITPTPEAVAAFQAAANEVSAGWPATIKIDGFDAAAFMQDAVAIAGGYSK
ncbi:MAG: TRAP transporter substrate-binding protein [Thermoleophilia bacterium]|nr:TRAP transporter substrate-binding protein [Thermoleophilia bacterium]